MIGPLLWLIYSLTYSDTERALLGSRRRVGVNVGFSDEDRIMSKICTALKIMEQKNLSRYLFSNKGGRMRGLNKLLKSCNKLARRQDEAAALKAYGISIVFLFCNIHAQT